MSCPPLPRSLLTFLLLLFFSEALVSCDTHMCRRFSRTARTTAAPRRKTSCVRAHVAKGRLYNSITIYVEIDRKSPDCSIPQNPFVLSLQVVNPFGYPVGDPVKGFQPSNIPETSCDPPPPGITTHYAQDAALQLIPCFYFKDGDYTQIVSESTVPPMALITPTAQDLAHDQFHFRVTWSFSEKDHSKKTSPKGTPSQLNVFGELFDGTDDTYLQFTGANSAIMKYIYQTASSTPVALPDCTDNPTIPSISSGSSFYLKNLIQYYNAARDAKSQEFEYRLPNVQLKQPQPTSDLKYTERDHFACRRLKQGIRRVFENSDSLSCIKLDAFPSPSGDNTVGISLSSVPGGDIEACKRWKMSEFVLAAYGPSLTPVGSAVLRVNGYSFVHFSGAGRSRKYLCELDLPPPDRLHFIQVLDEFKNLACPYVKPSPEMTWDQDVTSTNTPFIVHAFSTTFYTSPLDAYSIYFVWPFQPLYKKNVKFPSVVNFMVEAYIPYQNLVLVMLARHQIKMSSYTATPPGGQEAFNPYDSCFDGKTRQGISWQPKGNPVTDLPKEYYVNKACKDNPKLCDDMIHPPPLQLPSFTCREWRPDINRTTAVGDCFALYNTPARQENTVLVTLLFETACLPDYALEDFTVGAYNELGYPVGRLTESFSVYEGHKSAVCVDTWDAKDYTVGEIDPYTNYDCFYDENNNDKYIQEVNKTNLPTFFYGKSAATFVQDQSTRYIIWRVVWEYVQPAGYAGKHPTRVLFGSEVFLQSGSKVLIVLSKQPIQFNYIPSPADNPPSTPCNASSSPQSSIKVEKEKYPPVTIDPDPDYFKKCRELGVCVVPPSIVPTTLAPPPGPPTTTTTEPAPVVIIPGPPAEPDPIVEGKPSPPSGWVPKEKKRKKPSSVYEGCVERTKGCIVPPKGSDPRVCLKSKSCDLVIAFQRQDMVDAKRDSEDFVVLEMYHFDPGDWFAIGLNPSAARMADAYVLECVDEGSPDGPTMYNSRNLAGGAYQNRRYAEDGPEAAKLIIDLQESYRKGREIYCRFHIKVQFSRSVGEGQEKRFMDLHKMPFYVVAAWGSQFIAGAHGNLKRHRPYHFMKPPEGTSHKTVLGARYAPSPFQKPLIVSHGVTMLWVILFCLPIGSFIARFCKETFPSIKIRRQIPVWFILHILIMSLALALFIYSTWSEVEGHKRWVSLRKSRLHTWLGGATGGLFLLNFIMGCTAKVSVHEKLNPMGVAHGLLGHGLFFLGIGLIFRMDDVAFGNAPCFTKYIAGGLVFTYCVIYGVMTYHYSWVDWIVGLKKGRGSFGILPIGVLTERKVTEIIENRKSRQLHTRDYYADKNKDDVIIAPGRKVRIGALTLLTLLCTMYGMWMALIIFTNTRGPCIPLDKFKD